MPLIFSRVPPYQCHSNYDIPQNSTLVAKGPIQGYLREFVVGYWGEECILDLTE